MAYSVESWKNALAKARSYAGKTTPDNGVLAVWAADLASDGEVARLAGEEIAERLRFLRDLGVQNERGEKIFFITAYGALRAFLLAGKRVESQGNSEAGGVFLPEPWQHAVAAGAGVGRPGCPSRPALAASAATVLPGGVVELSIPCRATLANLAKTPLLPLILGQDCFTGKDAPAPFPGCHEKGVKLRYSGAEAGYAAERTWGAASQEIHPAKTQSRLQ